MDIRKEIDELVALYSLEPQLLDVYVEGERDKILIDWFLDEQGIEDINVYSIDIINVPRELIKRYGLNTGSNRSRVIALSIELATSLPEDLHILCVADRDHEDYLPSISINKYLEFTDYTSLDLYLFQKHTIQKFISLVLGGLPFTTDQFMHWMV